MPNSSAARVVHIVDDDPDILASLAFMLRSEEIETTIHQRGNTFLKALPGINPGCILLDVYMPGMTGLQLQQSLHECGCQMPVVIMTGHGDVHSAVTAMKQGAIDFIQKPFAKSDLLAALENAWSELSYPHPNPDERREAAEQLAGLTPRELQVTQALVNGQANKVIAYELGLSPRTVELYRANAMRKLGARSLSELLHVAFLGGMNGNYTRNRQPCGRHRPEMAGLGQRGRCDRLRQNAVRQA